MIRTITRVVATVLLVMAHSAFGQAHQQSDHYRGQHMLEGGWMFFGPLMMIAFIAVIVVVVVLLMRGFGGHRSGAAPSEDNALDILQERFARGEIDKEEYEERRRILRGR